MPDLVRCKNLLISAALAAVMAGAATAQDTGTAPDQQATTQAPAPTAMLDDGWGTAELARVDRDGDKMTVRVRFTKADGASGSKIVYGTLSRNLWETDIYLVSGNKKYLLLKDGSDKPLASSNLKLASDSPQAGAWYGTFPAPPSGENVTLYLPEMEPLGPFVAPQ